MWVQQEPCQNEAERMRGKTLTKLEKYKNGGSSLAMPARQNLPERCKRRQESSRLRRVDRA
jgi:hypothetical protein